MTRLCACDRVTVGGPFRPDLGQCVRCWLFHHREHVNRAWGGTGAVAAPAEAPPCAHRGDELGTLQIVAAGGNPDRRHFLCEGPEKPGVPRGRPVAACGGCGPSCPGYREEGIS